MEETTHSEYIGVWPLVLGILAIIVPVAGFVVGIVGIVFSSKALKRITPGQQTAKWMSISGLVCSIVGVCMQFLSILGIILFFAAARYMSFGP